MTGFEAITHMLDEEGTVVAVRLEYKDIRIDYDDILGGKVFSTAKEDLEADDWELGYQCDECNGNGFIEIPCPRCSGRSLHSLLENPCCGGWDEIECNECEGGIKWETEATGGAQ